MDKNYSLSNRRLKLKSSIDLTPLLDVVMLLIFFFLITGSFLSTSEKQINIDLPTSSENSSSSNSGLLIEIDKTGMIFWNGQQAQEMDLPRLIGASLQNNRDQLVRIKGDKEVNYQKIIEIMDIVKKSGASRLSLDVKNTTGNE